MDDTITVFEETLLNYINTKLNGENKNIRKQIMDDVIYNYLIHKPKLTFKTACPSGKCQVKTGCPEEIFTCPMY